MKLKSIFAKQMFLYLGILFISFVMLGTVLSMAYSKYYISEQEEQLISQGKKISDEFARAYYTGVINKNELNFRLQILEDYMNASVFLLNPNGKVEIASSGINQNWIGQSITDDAIKGVLEGKVVTVQGKVNGMFVESVLTVGYPITMGKNLLGGIFMCTSMPEIEKSVSGMYKAGIASMIIAMLVGAVMVYFSCRRISKPLMEMNNAAKIIAGGNFEKRIEIESEDEVGQLAASFNNMAESLFEHEKVRRDFIANVSHDLRSPLTSIQGFLNAILDGTIPSEKEEHYLNIVLDETKRLTKLTNDIVDLSRAESSSIALELQEFDINELIRDTLDSLEQRISKKVIDASVVFEEDFTMVIADPDKIQRVFYNLIDNAIKFTNEYGKIEIETTIKSNDKVFVYVRDNGKGISDVDQRHIFDRFFKADASRGEDKKGGGLGLAIAKEFIKVHNETISVNSSQGKGTEFMFTLSLAMPKIFR